MGISNNLETMVEEEEYLDEDVTRFDLSSNRFDAWNSLGAKGGCGP